MAAEQYCPPCHFPFEFIGLTLWMITLVSKSEGSMITFALFLSNMSNMTIESTAPAWFLLHKLLCDDR